MKATLREREVHVWRVSLDTVSLSAATREECLSVDERTRSAQFIAPLERARFIMSRIVLRHILAGYHGGAAAELRLGREPGGRPFIEGAERLFFSLSHSADTALIAVADVAIGVDVERVRRIGRASSIARRILHPDSVVILEAIPAGRRNTAFLDAWTQREAHVKAVGGGLFRTADVLPFDPSQPDDATIHALPSREDGSLWSVARFLPSVAARAAVVAPGMLRGIRIMDWHDIG
ncbi:MAG: 4'-phosphopantetheinyl transferase family protein [Longimicrobiales bacterium]